MSSAITNTNPNPSPIASLLEGQSSAQDCQGTQGSGSVGSDGAKGTTVSFENLVSSSQATDGKVTGQSEGVSKTSKTTTASDKADSKDAKQKTDDPLDAAAMLLLAFPQISQLVAQVNLPKLIQNISPQDLLKLVQDVNSSASSADLIAKFEGLLKLAGDGGFGQKLQNVLGILKGQGGENTDTATDLSAVQSASDSSKDSSGNPSVDLKQVLLQFGIVSIHQASSQKGNPDDNSKNSADSKKTILDGIKIPLLGKNNLPSLSNGDVLHPVQTEKLIVTTGISYATQELMQKLSQAVDNFQKDKSPSGFQDQTGVSTDLNALQTFLQQNTNSTDVPKEVFPKSALSEVPKLANSLMNDPQFSVPKRIEIPLETPQGAHVNIYFQEVKGEVRAQISTNDSNAMQWLQKELPAFRSIQTDSSVHWLPPQFEGGAQQNPFERESRQRGNRNSYNYDQSGSTSSQQDLEAFNAILEGEAA